MISQTLDLNLTSDGKNMGYIEDVLVYLWQEQLHNKSSVLCCSLCLFVLLDVLKIDY